MDNLQSILINKTLAKKIGLKETYVLQCLILKNSNTILTKKEYDRYKRRLIKSGIINNDNNINEGRLLELLNTK